MCQTRAWVAWCVLLSCIPAGCATSDWAIFPGCARELRETGPVIACSLEFATEWTEDMLRQMGLHTETQESHDLVRVHGLSPGGHSFTVFLTPAREEPDHTTRVDILWDGEVEEQTLLELELRLFTRGMMNELMRGWPGLELSRVTAELEADLSRSVREAEQKK
jgi:hypothetical protein